MQKKNVFFCSPKVTKVFSRKQLNVPEKKQEPHNYRKLFFFVEVNSLFGYFAKELMDTAFG